MHTIKHRSPGCKRTQTRRPTHTGRDSTPAHAGIAGHIFVHHTQSRGNAHEGRGTNKERCNQSASRSHNLNTVKQRRIANTWDRKGRGQIKLQHRRSPAGPVETPLQHTSHRALQGGHSLGPSPSHRGGHRFPTGRAARSSGGKRRDLTHGHARRRCSMCPTQP